MFSPQGELNAAIAVRRCGDRPEPAPPADLERAEPITAVDLRSLPSGTELVVETRNSRYHLAMLDDASNALVEGGRHFQQATIARVNGCTFGGCLIRLGWIAVGCRLEFSVCGRRVVTSHVRSISIKANAAAV